MMADLLLGKQLYNAIVALILGHERRQIRITRKKTL